MILSENRDQEYQKWKEAFEAEYRETYGFLLQNRSLVVDDLRVRGIGKSDSFTSKKISPRDPSSPSPSPLLYSRVYFSGGWNDHTPCYSLRTLAQEGSGTTIHGPALVLDELSTLVLENDSCLTITSYGNIKIEVCLRVFL
jgi:5-oxoprolinase (ATP-hydrolysing)